MNIVVCIKQVPDTTAEKKLDKDLRLDRTSVENILNPFDEYAVEEALRIKESAGRRRHRTLHGTGRRTGRHSQGAGHGR